MTETNDSERATRDKGRDDAATTLHLQLDTASTAPSWCSGWSKPTRRQRRQRQRRNPSFAAWLARQPVAVAGGAR